MSMFHDNHNTSFVVVFSPFMTSVQPAVVEAPLTAEESPAAKVKCYGAGLQPSAVHKGQKAMFTVDATQATVTNAPVNVTTTNLQTGIVMNIHRLSSHSSMNMYTVDDFTFSIRPTS